MKEKIVLFGAGKHYDLVKQGCVSPKMNVTAYMDNHHFERGGGKTA